MNYKHYLATTQQPYYYVNKYGVVVEGKRTCYHADDEVIEAAQQLVTDDYKRQFNNSDVTNDIGLKNIIQSGYICECAFKKAFGMELPKRLGQPDGGVDFELDGFTYDICCNSFISEVYYLPNRKKEAKADYFILAHRQNNRKKNGDKAEKLNPPITYFIDGVITKEAMQNLKEGTKYDDNFIKENYPIFYKANSGIFYGAKDTEKTWKEFKESYLFLPLKDKNGKVNPQVRFFNDDLPLVKSLLQRNFLRIV